MRKNIWPILATLLVGPPAFADTLYVGGRIGMSMIDDAVHTDPMSTIGLGALPDAISLNGRSFDSNETASGLFLGWEANSWLALELSYNDLGNTGQGLPLSLAGPVPILIQPNPQLPVPPGPVFIPVLPAQTVGAAALDVKEWAISARFSKALINNLSANWLLGVTRAQFDAQGQLSITELVSTQPLVINRTVRPYDSPSSETGFSFGFGFTWDYADRFAVDVGYRRHDTQVIEVDAVTLGLIVRL